MVISWRLYCDWKKLLKMEIVQFSPENWGRHVVHSHKKTFGVVPGIHSQQQCVTLFVQKGVRLSLHSLKWFSVPEGCSKIPFAASSQGVITTFRDCREGWVLSYFPWPFSVLVVRKGNYVAPAPAARRHCGISPRCAHHPRVLLSAISSLRSNCSAPKPVCWM